MDYIKAVLAQMGLSYLYPRFKAQYEAMIARGYSHNRAFNCIMREIKAQYNPTQIGA